jgi:hypothetical protein
MGESKSVAKHNVGKANRHPYCWVVHMSLPLLSSALSMFDSIGDKTLRTLDFGRVDDLSAEYDWSMYYSSVQFPN